MLTYKETLEAITGIERSIKDVEEKECSGEQLEYAVHLRRLLKHYIIEHRKAAERENQYAMR